MFSCFRYGHVTVIYKCDIQQRTSISALIIPVTLYHKVYLCEMYWCLRWDIPVVCYRYHKNEAESRSEHN